VRARGDGEALLCIRSEFEGYGDRKRNGDEKVEGTSEIDGGREAKRAAGETGERIAFGDDRSGAAE
jgi:hypothetical protein